MKSAAITNMYDPISVDRWKARPEQLALTNRHDKRLHLLGGALALLIKKWFLRAII